MIANWAKLMQDPSDAPRRWYHRPLRLCIALNVVVYTAEAAIIVFWAIDDVHMRKTPRGYDAEISALATVFFLLSVRVLSHNSAC